MRYLEKKIYEASVGLNPCCNGIYSMSSLLELCYATQRVVLILVVMEYTQ